jgi:mannitol-specific phosphotransferase system IIBC component
MKRGTGKERTSIESLRAITNLAAVLAGIIAVAGLTVVAIELLNSEEKSEAAIAITTAAFGIVSTVVTAYLGIKATANASDNKIAAATDKIAEVGGEAAVARQEESVKRRKVDRLNEEIDRGEEANEISKEMAQKLRGASVEAEERARQVDAPDDSV